MKAKIKPLFDEMIALAEAEGLDLHTDSIERTIYYPEHPEVPLTIILGGLFTQELGIDLEEEELH